MPKRRLSRRALLGRGGALAAAPLASPLVAAAAPSAAKLGPPPTLGAPPGVALLSRNENPFGPSPRAVAAGDAAVRAGAWYADRSLLYLVDAIAARTGLTRDHVTVSAGSGEGLCAAAQALTRGGGAIVAPALFWDASVRYAARQGVRTVLVPLTNDLSIDLAAMAAAVDDETALVHLTNPNNPTGLTLPPEALRAFIRKVGRRATVIVDEAYNEFADDPDAASVVDLVAADENVIVSRTFSKIYGMAGLRVGYLLAHPDMTARIRSNVMSWISGPGLAAAIASYDDPGFLAASRAATLEAREATRALLEAAGLRVLPSQTNFLWFDVGGDAEAFRKRMEEASVYVRPPFEGWPAWSRVSMGRPEDMAAFEAALPRALDR